MKLGAWIDWKWGSRLTTHVALIHWNVSWAGETMVIQNGWNIMKFCFSSLIWAAVLFTIDTQSEINEMWVCVLISGNLESVHAKTRYMMDV